MCGILESDEKGEINFKAIKLQVDIVPEDGLDGDLLRFGGCHPWRPTNVHFMISVDNYEKETNHLFVKKILLLAILIRIGREQHFNWNTQ